MRYVFFILLFIVFSKFKTYGQQDVEFHVESTFLAGTKVLKVKKDFYDPFVWVLGDGNRVYRINSISMSVDDFSSVFSSYSSLKFIDIAGRSQDTVFIATKSKTLLVYLKGTVKSIGQSEGITSNINSIGIFRPDLQGDLHRLTIGCDKGLFHYDMAQNKINRVDDVLAGQVYEATYRTHIFKDSSVTFPDWDGKKYVPIVSFSTQFAFSHYASESSATGTSIRTAYEVFGSLYDNISPPAYTALFWGTNKGLFQVNGEGSYFVNRPVAHYLDGISVNKITTMFGLTAFGSGYWFGNPGLIKQTMLIGTDKGLYFTRSIYFRFNNDAEGRRDIKLYHFDPLGVVKINDISVNTASTTPPVCDDGVWVATQRGLFLLRPDYGKFENTGLINALQFKEQPSATVTQICNGTSITMQVNPKLYAGHTVKWYKDGNEINGQQDLKLIVNTSGSYHAVLYDLCGNNYFATNNLSVQIISQPVAFLNYPNNNYYCSSTPVSYEIAANPSYKYRWYRNNVLTAETSNKITVSNSGEYKVEVSACTGNWIASNVITANFVSLPSVSVSADKAAYCEGESAVLSTNLDTNPSFRINWLKDGALIPSTNDKTVLKIKEPGEYSVLITSKESNCSNTSSVKTVIFEPRQEIHIQKNIITSLCSGQEVELEAHASAGNIIWSTGETGHKIKVSKSGSYTATLTSAGGCTISQTEGLAFFENPKINIEDAVLCQFTGKRVTLEAPAGFNKYEWNGLQGGKSYTVGQPGKVTLTVTDLNGCTATQEITVSNHCEELNIANTFTPNGDGVNDTWAITGLDASAVVTIFDRRGHMVMESRGYNQPWDATYNGSKVPSGTYYFVIKAKSGKQITSGWLSVLY